MEVEQHDLPIEQEFDIIGSHEADDARASDYNEPQQQEADQAEAEEQQVEEE